MSSQTSISKILVPVDFSDTSKKNLEKALDLQKKYDAEIIVANFIAPINNVANLYNVSFVDIETKLMDEAKARMMEFCEECEISLDDTLVEVGHPKKSILNLAESKNVDLIVMGSHGHHGLIDTMLGSTANAIASHAKCDVLIVRS